MGIHNVLHFRDQASQTRLRKPALEHRELHTLAVLFANVGDASQPRRTVSLSVRDVVCDKDVHRVYGSTNGA